MTTPPEPRSQPRRWQDELSATGDELVAQVKKVVQEGNVRRVIIKHDDRTLLEFPLTLGVVGTLLAPQVAALGALAALITHCTVTIEREEPEPGEPTDATTRPLPPPER
jgi:hypothetical protein